MSIRVLSKLTGMALFICSFSSATYADWGVDSHWNDPGVTVRQPNVWSNPNVMVSDPLGRPAPNSEGSCRVMRICYKNGNCVLEKVCN